MDRRVGKDFSLSITFDGTNAVSIDTLVDVIDGPGLAAEVADVSILGDTYRQKRSTIVDPGELTFAIVDDPNEAEYNSLVAALEGRTLCTYTVTAASISGDGSAVETGACYVTGFEKSTGGLSDMATVDVTLTLTGDPGLLTT